MRAWQRQSHVKWYCRYHVVIVPKYRQKAIFGTLRKDIGHILRELCEPFDIELIEGHAMPDHVHLCLSILPKYSMLCPTLAQTAPVSLLPPQRRPTIDLYSSRGVFQARRFLPPHVHPSGAGR